MIKYPIFYRHYGTRLLKHLVNPRVIDASTLEFPVRSVFYNYMVSDVATDISKDDIFLKQASQVAVYTASEYSVEVLGSLRRLPKILNVIITEMAKKEKRLVFKKPNSAPPIESPRLLIVHHYGMLGEFYRYNINNLNRYFKFKNTLGTVVHDLSLYLAEQPNLEEAKHVFLKFDIPNQLPSRRELDIYSKNMNPMFLKKLPNYRYLNVLELWKLLTPEYRNESVFSKIPVNQLSKIDLLITIDAKVTIVNLGLLMSLVKDYNLNISSEELEEDIKLVGELTTEDLKIKQKFKPDIVKKLLYVFLYRIINVKFKDKTSKTKQVTQDKQNLSETTTSLLVEDDGTDNDLTIDLDKILENDILEADSGDEEDSDVVKEKQITINRTRTSDRDLTADDDDDDIDYGMDYDADTDVINISETLSNSETVTTYNSVDEVYKEEPNDYLNAIRNIEILFDSGIISKKERNNLEDILERQKSLTSTYVTGKSDKLIDILDPSTDSYEVGLEDCSITSSPGVPDPTLNKNKVGTIDKKYISKQYKKDIMRVFYSLQKHNCVLENYEILERDSVLGGEETHMVTLRLYTGRRIKFSIVLPTINEDGTFKMSSNTYRMRKQRTELPIRRINDNQVVLNSYYTKLFLERAVQKQFDKGYRFFKKISYLFQNTDTVVAMSPANGEPNYDVTMPSQYAYIARYLLSFKTQNALYHFNYKTRKSILNTDIDIEKIEGKEYILIGVTTNNDPIFINFNNELFHYRNNQFLKVDDLLTQLGISQSELPSEYATLKIMKERVPVVLILSYYIGLQNLLKLTGMKYEVHEINARVSYNPSTHYIVKFKDKKLLLPYTNTYLDLIFNGLIIVSKFIKDNVNLDSLNTKDGYSSIFAYLKYKQYVQTEIKLLENMFVDPITMSILKEMKEPITFKGLLIRATEIMSIENFKHPNHMEGTAIKGYERIAGLTYNTLITALKNYENTAYFSKGSFTINPYCIKNVILDDSTTVLVDDLNPVSFLKQQEDVTYLGAGGRGSRLSMSRDTRIMHESEVGIVSEGVKDNGDVGITFYLSADPNINNIRGIAEPTTAEKTSWAGILSSTAVLFPFSRTDDVKRINFTSIQSAHTVPMNNMRAPYVRTGYESIFAIRSGKKFVVPAEDSGKVASVSKNKIVVEYDKLGKKSYNIKNWTSKEESHSCYTHVMVPNLKPGDRFIKDDTLIYDKLFFEPDIFNPKRVILKLGTTCNLCFMEDQQTYEDSAAISSKMSKVMGCNVTKIMSTIINCEDSILNLVKVGDRVEPETVLYTIASKLLGEKPSEATSKLLESISRNTPKAKYRGVVSKVVIYYNCELDEMSKSLREEVMKTNEELVASVGYNGQVTSSYSTSGRKLLPKDVEIKIYIDIDEDMGIGDKMILGNQMKCTVGEVFNNDIRAEDGREIDAMFSYRSIGNRIVCSMNLIGTTSTILEKVQENAVDIYFK